MRLPHGAAVAAAAAAAAGGHFGAKGLNFAASPPSLSLHHSHHHAHIKQESSINALYDNFMTPPALSVKLA